TNMSSMFDNSQVTSLDLSNWDTSNVIDMSSMFYNSQVTSLDVSKWNTSNVTDMNNMFSNFKATSLDLSNWDTSNVIDMSWMFDTSQVTSLDVSNWDTSNVTNMANMFERTSLLREIKLGEKSKFNSTVNLRSIDTTSGEYTGKWERIDPKSPISEYNSSTDFMDKYDGTLPGTYVWQRAKTPAKDLTVFYQDTDGNKLAESKTVSGNIGDTFNETPLEIEGYTFKEVKDNTPTEGTLSDKEQSITFIYTKNPVKAKDLTVFYQDTDGNDISKSKVVPGNIGDTFNETPLEIEGYTFKEVKDNTPTEGTLSDKEQSITFIYTKNPIEPSKDKNEKATATETTGSSNTDEQSGTKELTDGKAISSGNGNNQQTKSLPKTGEEVSSTITFAGITTLLLASCVWLAKRRQNKKQ
ncbi:MucBP domain-containing protein, partial [Enterococcus faecalis]